MRIPTHIAETVAIVEGAIEAGDTENIEYLFNRNLYAPSDGEALLAAIPASRIDENHKKLWRASACAFLGRRDDAARALEGARGLLAEKFRALFGLSPWYANWRTHETARAVWRCPDADYPAPAMAQEAAYHALTAFFGFDLDQKPLIFLWPSRDAARKQLGRGLGFAIPQYYLIHSAYDQSPGHELAHLFAHYLPGAREKSAFVAEGAAVMLDQTGKDRVSEAREAMTRLGIESVDIPALWRDFSSLHSSVSYPVAGLFCARFLAAYGKHTFLELLRHPSYEDARARFGAAHIDFLIHDAENVINR